MTQIYTHLDFIIINIILCASLIITGTFGWLILGEKLTKLQILIFSFILVWIFTVNYF